MKLTLEKGKEPTVAEDADPKEGPKGDPEAIPGSMQSYIQRYPQDVPDGSDMFVHQDGERIDAQVVNVDGTFFYRPGKTGDWHMANPDGKTSRLYEGDPIAMNTLENRLATLGIKYGERATAPLQAGEFTLTPDPAATTGTLVVYSGTVPGASAEGTPDAAPSEAVKFTVQITGAPDAKGKYISVLVSQDGTTTETVCKDKAELETCLKALEAGTPTQEEPAPAVRAEPEEAAAVADDAPTLDTSDTTDVVNTTTGPADVSVESSPKATLAALEDMERSVMNDLIPVLEAFSSADSGSSNEALATMQIFDTAANGLETYLNSHDLPTNFESHLGQTVALLRASKAQCEVVSQAEKALTDAQRSRLTTHMDGKLTSMESAGKAMMQNVFTNPNGAKAYIQTYLDSFGHVFDDLKQDSELGSIAKESDKAFDGFVALGNNWIAYQNMKEALGSTA